MKDNVTIFYTDDDPDDHMLFEEVVTDLYNSVSLYLQRNGKELLYQLKNRPPTPKIIFLDLNMPVKNGFETLREIKESVDLRAFPIIIFTTADDPTSINETRRLGADLFITKPPDYAAYRKAISYVLSLDWNSFKAGQENFVYQVN